MAIANKYPNGRTGGWNLKNPIFKDKLTLDDIRRGDPSKRKDLEETVYKPDVLPSTTPMVKHGLIDNIKRKKWLVLGLVAVAGFFAYKKFKK
jgi:hypothetical protein